MWCRNDRRIETSEEVSEGRVEGRGYGWLGIRGVAVGVSVDLGGWDQWVGL